MGACKDKAHKNRTYSNLVYNLLRLNAKKFKDI